MKQSRIPDVSKQRRELALGDMKDFQIQMMGRYIGIWQASRPPCGFAPTNICFLLSLDLFLGTTAARDTQTLFSVLLVPCCPVLGTFAFDLYPEVFISPVALWNVQTSTRQI
jgi:hypothetical protein